MQQVSTVRADCLPRLPIRYALRQVPLLRLNADDGCGRDGGATDVHFALLDETVLVV